MDGGEIAELWAESGCADLTAHGVPAPSGLVHLALALIRLLDRHGAGLADEFPAAGLGVLSQRARLLGLERSGRVSCGRATRLIAARDADIGLSLARETDIDLLPALASLVGCHVESPVAAGAWSCVEAIARSATSAELVAAAAELGLPVAANGEVNDPRPAIARHVGRAAPRHVAGLRVVNLGSLWAAPLAAQMLARLGCDVVAVESTTRPDGARSTPAFFNALREGVTGVMVDLTTDDGPAELKDLVASADIVIEGSRPRALRHLGIFADELLGAGPRLWLSVTGHGRAEPVAARVGLGDDAAVAGGLTGRGPDGQLVFLADAVADPLSGLVVASAAVEQAAAGGRYLVDVALARVAAAAALPVRRDRSPAIADVV